MKSRGLATIAAAAALATGGLAGQAAATTHDRGGGQKNCTRSEQRTDTTRFKTRSCVTTSDDRVRADLRIEVRAQMPSAAMAADANVRIRDASATRSATATCASGCAPSTAGASRATSCATRSACASTCAARTIRRSRSARPRTACSRSP